VSWRLSEPLTTLPWRIHLTYIIGESRKREYGVDAQIFSSLPRKVRGSGDYDGNLAADDVA